MFTLLIIGTSSVFYAFKIEPYRLSVKAYDLNEPAFSEKGLKIVQFSDTHIKEGFDESHLAKVVDKMNAEKPDIVIFTGDLYDNYAKYNDDEGVINQLKKIDAAITKVAVWGNHDYGGGAVRAFEHVMNESDFEVLKNENKLITLENNQTIWVTGLDDTMLGQPYLPDMTGMEQADFTLLLSHEPDVAAQYFNQEYDLILTGHSHGGQVNIPFLPGVNKLAVSTTDHAENYNSGLYQVGSSEETTLYVNRGIGTTHIAARFGVVPEIAVFNIN